MLNHTAPPSISFEFDSFWTPSTATLTAASSLLLIAGTRYAYPLFFGNSKKIHALGGLPLVNAWAFFNKRYDFLRSNFDKGYELFSFKMVHHEVVALSGEASRKVFFHDKNLDLEEGFKMLTGGSPRLDDIKPGVNQGNIEAFNKRLLKLLRRDRMQDIIPALFGDVNKRMEGWGQEGRLEPFEEINDLVFQMTVRMASCEELATDPVALKRMCELYRKLEGGSTLSGLLLPWFPSKAQRDKKESTRSLYEMLLHYVNLRRKADVPRSDALDLLIADGDTDDDIIGTVLGIIFAGVVNTGMISSWSAVYLGVYPEWRAKAIAEIQKLIATHTNTTSSEPLHQRLSAVPISAWEDEMPVLESIIRETIRFVLALTLTRRNVGEDIEISGQTIHRGAFVVYNIADVHLKEEHYPDALKFDPGRPEGPFIGWGTGRHPCTGMKVAKFEIKMILALLLTRYDYTLVNKSGGPATELPTPDRNNILQMKPIGESCYLDFRKIME